MQYPQVNLNGTLGAILLRQYLDAADALRAAERRLDEAAPHGRDYQTLDDGAFRRAQDEHLDRKRRLESIIQELLDIAQEIARQNDEREISRRRRRRTAEDRIADHIDGYDRDDLGESPDY